jgi:hypothetical protein
MEIDYERFGNRVRFAGPPRAYTETYEIMEVTPDQAMEWIAAAWQHYKSGRNFYPTQIEKIRRYASEMRSGEWQWRADGEAICLKDGVIAEGRHRLHAILLSGKTVKCTVKHKNLKKD